MATKLVRSGRRGTNGSSGPVTKDSSREEINAKYGHHEAEDGYSEATTFGVSWDYFEQPILKGTVDGAGVRMVDLTKSPDKPRFSLKVSVIEHDTGAVYDVWDSASLTDFFRRARPGDDVKLTFEGQKENPKGGADMKILRGFFKGGLPPVREDASPDKWDGTWNYLVEDKPEPVQRKPRASAKVIRPSARR